MVIDMDDRARFDESFGALTGNPPLGWQRRLFFEHFSRGEIPEALDIPTGLGKTSVIVVWLLALARDAAGGTVRLPRRLVYVVDRRTVVDQATDTAEKLRSNLKRAGKNGVLAQIRGALGGLCLDPNDEASPLAVSTLRGELADNREWQADPARPAIIIGTVDMIGSRLLFSGYGISRRMRPFHAGLLGQDTLLIHDEAHLSPAFGELARAVSRQQQKAPRPLIVMELSATQRERGDEKRPFVLTDSEKAEPIVAARLKASKCLQFVAGAEDESAIAKLVDCAVRYNDEAKRVLVYVRRPRHAKALAAKLAAVAKGRSIALLTGTIRGYERDALVKSPLFAGFRANPKRHPPQATEYLVATSAGEVGIDVDADHMVCDLSTLDSMIQRLGRVNRLGGRESDVHVLEWKESKKEFDGELTERLSATKQALDSLPERNGGRDASPQALRALAGRTEAFSPKPRIAPLTDILIDNWSLTRLDELPGRPLPERWLHGVERNVPDLSVAWRDEVEELVTWARDRDLKLLYDKHRILARERVRGPLHEVKPELEQIAKRAERRSGKPLKAILLPVRGEPIADDLSALLEDEGRLPNATIVLPPAAGGLGEHGMLDSAAETKASLRYDVADVAAGEGEQQDDVGETIERSRALLQWIEEEGRWSARWLGRSDRDELDLTVAATPNLKTAVSAVLNSAAQLVQKDLLVFEDEQGEPARAIVLLGRAASSETAEDNPATASRTQLLEDHLMDVEKTAELIVARLAPLLDDNAEASRIADAVVIAARRHDLGKNRDSWQADVGHPRPRKGGADWKPLAKSGRNGFVSRLSGAYRHEFGSLREATQDRSILTHPERDLILHLIAAHHGWARPHFEPGHWDIADGVSEEENAAIASETMRRFARLQRRFGHWGLAWLEALLRAADYAATERLGTEEPAPTPPSGYAHKTAGNAV